MNVRTDIFTLPIHTRISLHLLCIFSFTQKRTTWVRDNLKTIPAVWTSRHIPQTSPTCCRTNSRLRVPHRCSWQSSTVPSHNLAYGYHRTASQASQKLRESRMNAIIRKDTRGMGWVTRNGYRIRLSWNPLSGILLWKACNICFKFAKSRNDSRLLRSLSRFSCLYLPCTFWLWLRAPPLQSYFSSSDFLQAL